MQYEVVIIHVSTRETKKGIINHSNISAFAKSLALHNWLLVEHSSLAVGVSSEFRKISIGKERDKTNLNKLDVVSQNTEKEVRNNEDSERIIGSSIP